MTAPTKAVRLANMLGPQFLAAMQLNDDGASMVKLRGRIIRHVCGDNATAANDDPEGALVTLFKARRSTDPEAVIREAAAATSWPKAMTPDELDAAKFPEPSWLLDGVLPSNGLSLLVSSPDGGKSTLTRTLAMAVAEGATFLGHTTRQGPVWYGGFEEDPARTRDHLRSMGWTPKLPIHSFLQFPPDQEGIDPYEWIEAEVVRVKPALVILDTLSDILPFDSTKDTEGYIEVRRKCRPLMQLARDHEVCILACHHARKGDAGNQWRDMVMGSNAYRSAVDTTLFIDFQADDRRILKSSQRYKLDGGGNLPNTILNLDPTNNRVISGGGVEAEKKRDLVQTALDACADNGGKMLKTALVKAMGGNAETARTALVGAVADGTMKSWEGLGRAVWFGKPDAIEAV